ncbi:Beta-galactosidase trimerisation domain-containing protein [Micromonospora pallida]|uniref:Beta-galactosidase trimerisation domain-containing protein n=1 Tax=Micromonospora pallida TaxID=145854 RepID=A0A1C6SIL5_9ACTN|nr:beta-galactosidase trimerization domain-containing protein [Micromonospora pallida]SCL29248.1 Beta-galactosidase trimerisation domain-containing protein [Micromonospora pallida]
MTAASRYDGPRWWDSPFRLLQTNLREEDALLDAPAAVDQLVDLGYDTWLCNAGGIMYFYPTHEAYQRPAARLRERPSGDMVGDVLAAAHARDVRVLSRFDFSRLPTEVIADHPEWAFVDKDGEWFTEDGLTAICPRSDYHELLVPRILRDFVERYPVDGVFFNWLQYPEVAYSGIYKGVCQCERCRTAFQAAHPGRQHPRTLTDDGYGQWLEVALRLLTELAERYSSVVNDVRPGTPLMLADVRMDIAFLETNSALDHNGDRWWAHTPSELASVNRLSDPGVPALVHSSVNLGLPYRQIAEEPTQFQRYIAQALSRGALPSTVVVGAVEAGRYPCLDAAADLLGFLREHTELYAGFTPANRVAVLRPRGGTALSAMQNRVDFSEYRGVYTALQEAHIPFDVLGLQFQDRLVGDDVVSRYDVVVVPGAEGLEEPLRQALDDFVRGGGTLVLTGEVFDGETPIFDSDPVTRRVRRLAGLAELGGRYVGPADGRTDEPLHPVLGHFSVVERGADATVGRLALSTQTPFGPPEITGGNSARGGAPALVRGRYGEGAVSHFPWAIGTTAHTSGLTALHRVIADEVRSLLAAPHEIDVDLPTQVEITLGRSGGRWVMHLVNHSGGRGDRVRASLPARGTVTLGGPLADAARQGVHALVDVREIQPESVVDGRVRIPVELDGVLEVIRLG